MFKKLGEALVLASIFFPKPSYSRQIHSWIHRKAELGI